MFTNPPRLKLYIYIAAHTYSRDSSSFHLCAHNPERIISHFLWSEPYRLGGHLRASPNRGTPLRSSRVPLYMTSILHDHSSSLNCVAHTLSYTTPTEAQGRITLSELENPKLFLVTGRAQSAKTGEGRPGGGERPTGGEKGWEGGK